VNQNTTEALSASPYFRGYDAKAWGATTHDNPYPEHTALSREWLMGFKAAVRRDADG